MWLVNQSNHSICGRQQRKKQKTRKWPIFMISSPLTPRPQILGPTRAPTKISYGASETPPIFLFILYISESWYLLVRVIFWWEARGFKHVGCPSYYMRNKTANLRVSLSPTIAIGPWFKPHHEQYVCFFRKHFSAESMCSTVHSVRKRQNSMNIVSTTIGRIVRTQRAIKFHSLHSHRIGSKLLLCLTVACDLSRLLLLWRFNNLPPPAANINIRNTYTSTFLNQQVSPRSKTPPPNQHKRQEQTLQPRVLLPLSRAKTLLLLLLLSLSHLLAAACLLPTYYSP